MKDYKSIHFLTCGHVDDGKSTLIGRLLYDLNVVPDDQIVAAKDKSGQIDYALFTDGLSDERRQGITIDVAHRYFRYGSCRYHIADTPGHLEYMRNMAVAAVFSDLAVILVDGVHGVRLQTVEYSRIAHFFGVKQFLVAINKMDAVQYSEQQFNDIKNTYLDSFGEAQHECQFTFIPVSALCGDNITTKSDNTPWYQGETVLSCLEKTESNNAIRRETNVLRLPVQHALKDDESRRWYFGTLHGGTLTVGQTLMTIDSKQKVNVTAITVAGEPVSSAHSNQAMAMTIAEEVDLSRGTVLAQADQAQIFNENFYADVLWLDKQLEGREVYQGMIKLHHAQTMAQIEVQSQNGVLRGASVSLACPLAMDAFKDSPATGLFIVIDPNNERVVGVGTIREVISFGNQQAALI